MECVERKKGNADGLVHEAERMEAVVYTHPHAHQPSGGSRVFMEAVL